MKNKCFIDKNIIFTEANIALIKEMNLDIVYYDKNNSDFNEIEYLLFHSQLSDEELTKMKNCRYIGIRAHNTDYVNKCIAEKMGIFIEGLKIQHGANAVAEHTFALIFAIMKNLITSHRNIIENRWRKDLGSNYELTGKKLGIIGNGKIGSRVAEIGRVFGMEILIAGKNESLKSDEMFLEEVLRKADIITLHLSSKEENKNYINSERLKLMKKGSILINTARGSVLDYTALEEEIKNGKFLGVGLDVFPEEPPKENKFNNYSNVIMTPHVGYMTKETIEKMNNELLLNLKKYKKWR